MKVKTDLFNLFSILFESSNELNITGSFHKANSELRNFKGLLNHREETVGIGKSNKEKLKENKVVVYYDTDKNEFRSFKLDRLRKCSINNFGIEITVN